MPTLSTPFSTDTSVEPDDLRVALRREAGDPEHDPFGDALAGVAGRARRLGREAERG